MCVYVCSVLCMNVCAYARTQIYLPTIFDIAVHSKSVVPKVCYAEPGRIRDQFTGDPSIHLCNGAWGSTVVKALCY